MTFDPNFTKKQYERQYSEIKKQFKSNGTHRDNLLRKLEISEKYDNDYLNLKEVIPNGLELSTLDTPLIKLAETEILNIARNYDINSTNITNYRFYINTPYFDRKGTDEFPLFELNDPRVASIKDLVLSVVENKKHDLTLLNILVRVYSNGDVLNFHSDRDIFGDEIYGLVVYNNNQERGIMLSNKKSRYVVPEISGTLWKLSGESRWDYEHGYCSEWKKNNIDRNNNICRIVISFRFFENTKQIPKKKFENKIEI